MGFITKIVLTILVILFYSFEWWNTYKLFKRSPNDIGKELQLISLITLLCTLGVVGSVSLIWCT